jgi:hypothetical protein
MSEGTFKEEKNWSLVTDVRLASTVGRKLSSSSAKVSTNVEAG